MTSMRAREDWLATLDPGIAPYVDWLDSKGVETFESCEGGEGPPGPRPPPLSAVHLGRPYPLATLVVGPAGADALAAHDPPALWLGLRPRPARARADRASVLLGDEPVALRHRLRLHRAGRSARRRGGSDDLGTTARGRAGDLTSSGIQAASVFYRFDNTHVASKKAGRES